MKKYKLISILFVIFVIFFVLMSLLVGCNKNSLPSGNLKIKLIDCHTIDVVYSYYNSQYPLLTSPQDELALIPGSHSGVHRYSNLSPNTLYTFYLLDGLAGNLAKVTIVTPSH